MADGSEKRRDPRVPLVLRVDYPAEPGAVRDATENLSAGGLFVRTERPLEPGEELLLEVSFPGLLDPLAVTAEVVWRREAGKGGPAGVAVRIPSARPEDRARLAQLAETVSRTAAAGRGYRILVVEDNPHVVEMYDFALKKLRASAGGLDLAVEYTANGHEALTRLEQPPAVDLVMADLYMPVMDGFTLIERMKADDRLAKVPLLVISAGGSEARARAVDLGVDVYLQKPVVFADILATVRTLLQLGG
jgi:uncharacterized protein (TIGR02266 family)